MIEIANSTGEQIEHIVNMKDMEPLQVGYIQSRAGDTELVMRTAYVGDSMKTEIMNLSRPGRNMCWTPSKDGDKSKVRLLRPDESIMIRLYGDPR